MTLITMTLIKEVKENYVKKDTILSFKKLTYNFQCNNITWIMLRRQTKNFF